MDNRIKISIKFNNNEFFAYGDKKEVNKHLKNFYQNTMEEKKKKINKEIWDNWPSNYYEGEEYILNIDFSLNE